MPPIFACGGDLSPDRRDDCPNALHDWPLPSGYVDAGEVAARRLRERWANPKCPDCGLYGWRPGRIRETDKQVPA